MSCLQGNNAAVRLPQHLTMLCSMSYSLVSCPNHLSLCRSDDSLVEEGMAREIINRVQKLRKNAGLVATDSVDIYLRPLTNGKSAGRQAVCGIRPPIV